MNFLELTKRAVGCPSCRRRRATTMEAASARLKPYGLGLAALFFASAAFAQNPAQRPPPHIGFVYPAGGQQGATFTVSVGGQNLNGDVVAYLTGSGAQMKVTGYERPLTGKEAQELRDEAQKLQEKRVATRTDSTKPAFTVADEQRLADIRDQVAKRANRQANPGIAETVTLEVTLAADASPGEREIRLKTPGGWSNPMIFCVGQLPEFSEKVATATSEPPAGANFAQAPRAGRPPTEMKITLPAIVNGQILPGESDRFHFAARQGQRLVAVVNARALIPYLADAVPGWFQATLALRDAQGRELAYDDDFRFNPDPVLAFTIPRDGDYVIEVKDALYRGREDFTYRVAIGELPFVTGIFPLGGTAGQPATFKVTGWNLPVDSVAMETKDKSPGTFLLSVRNQDILSNSVRFALDAQPECLDTEPNDRGENAQPLALPVIVNGRIDRPGDVDVFRFEGKSGAEIVAEVVARRLGSPLDSTLTLTDAAGVTLASNDDFDDKGAGLLTHQADSRLSFKLPADGVYFLTLADTQHQGGPEFAYRLRVGSPQPDFELRVTPSAINARAGAGAPITVYALRRDGFNGEITLALRGAPRGFSLSGARIPAGQDKVQLTLNAPPVPHEEPLDLMLVGVAAIHGKIVTRAAVPAEDMMQAFAYRHLVPAREFKVAVTGRGPAFKVIGRLPLQITAGGTVQVRVTSPAARFVSNVQFELSDPPAGITLQSCSGKGDFIDVVLACDAAAVKPGLQGNLMLNATGERTNPNAKNAAARTQRVPLGSVPAIPFEVVGALPPAT